MLQTKLVEKIKTHILCSIIFFLRKYAFHEIMWGKHRIGQATDENMAHAHCVMETYGYKHIFRVCYTYCFSISTMVARKRLNVTLSVLLKLGNTNTQRKYHIV